MRRAFVLATMVVVTMFLVPTAHAADYVPETPYFDGGFVCVARMEDNGFLNIWPVRVAFEHGINAQINGGMALCAYLETGRREVRLTWEDQERIPYEGSTVFVDVPNGGRTQLLICNTHVTAADAEGEPWMSGWIIAPPEEARARCS